MMIFKFELIKFPSESESNKCSPFTGFEPGDFPCSKPPCQPLSYGDLNAPVIKKKLE